MLCNIDRSWISRMVEWPILRSSASGCRKSITLGKGRWLGDFFFAALPTTTCISLIIIVSSGETNLDLCAKMMYSSKYRHFPVLEDEGIPSNDREPRALPTYSWRPPDRMVLVRRSRARAWRWNPQHSPEGVKHFSEVVVTVDGLPTSYYKL